MGDRHKEGHTWHREQLVRRPVKCLFYVQASQPVPPVAVEHSWNSRHKPAFSQPPPLRTTCATQQLVGRVAVGASVGVGAAAAARGTVAAHSAVAPGARGAGWAQVRHCVVWRGAKEADWPDNGNEAMLPEHRPRPGAHWEAVCPSCVCASQLAACVSRTAHHN